MSLPLVRRRARLAVTAIGATLLAGRTLPAQPAPPPSTASTAPAVRPITIGEQTSLRSGILGEERPILVHLPRSYSAASSTRYPVLYLLDGDAHFATVTAMVDFLAGNGRAPEMIVVGIPNTRDRTHDLTPATDSGVVKFAMSPGSRDTVSQRFPTAGGAPKMQAFLTTELAPWIESRYRVAPYRVLVGHSFGGLFAVDALTRAPRSFNAYVAISPSLWWDHGRYVKQVEQTLTRAPLSGIALYMTTGAREPAADMIDPARHLAAALDAAHPAGFRSWYKVMPAETHGSNPLRTTYDALEQLFAGWEPADSVMEAVAVRGDLGPLEAHYATLTRRFGFPVTVSVDQINQAGYLNLQAKRVDAAVALFRRNVRDHPDYANGWDSLADGLEAQGKIAEAIAAQEKAVALGTAQKDLALGTYATHLDRLRKLPVR
jgi:predicted alpha/beta superfamily hydrolase